MECETCSNCVTSQCGPGYYGAACNIPCRETCRTFPCASCECALCDATSGKCLNGCTSGWYGELCESQCPTNCSTSHSFSVQQQCERLSGVCLYGCRDGTFGRRCNETCGENCEKWSCNQTTGECLNGCITGFQGGFCQERLGDEDQLAGAVGGAFVIILWGLIVVIIMCVIRRRRQKEYAALARKSRSLNSGRGSSRRSLQRQASTSSGHPQQGQAGDMEQLTYEIAIPDVELQRAEYNARRQHFMRSYSDESPMTTNHLCADQPEMLDMRSAAFRKKCHSFQCDYDIPDDDDDEEEDQSYELNKSSDDEAAGGANDAREVWRARKF